MQQAVNRSYVLGHADGELERLGRQAGIFGEMTHQILLRAGMAPGMRVLDLGCGAGDVSFTLSGIVGPRGSVHGIDLAPVAVAAAEQRAVAAGYSNVSFEAANLNEFSRYSDFDAVVGRFVLMHMPDPGAVVRGIARQVRPGALIAFAEFDLNTASTTREISLFRRSVDQIIATYQRAGFEPNMGSKLYDAFRFAGLAPALTAFTRAGEIDATGVEFLVESMRSLLPAMEKVGVATAADIDLPTLGERFAAEAAGACVFYPRLVGAWACT